MSADWKKKTNKECLFCETKTVVKRYEEAEVYEDGVPAGFKPTLMLHCESCKRSRKAAH